MVPSGACSRVPFAEKVSSTHIASPSAGATRKCVRDRERVESAIATARASDGVCSGARPNTMGALTSIRCPSSTMIAKGAACANAGTEAGALVAGVAWGVGTCGTRGIAEAGLWRGGVGTLGAAGVCAACCVGMGAGISLRTWLGVSGIGDGAGRSAAGTPAGGTLKAAGSEVGTSGDVTRGPAH